MAWLAATGFIDQNNDVTSISEGVSYQEKMFAGIARQGLHWPETDPLVGLSVATALNHLGIA